MLPDAAMMVGPESIARFIETGEPAALAGVFADDVVIIENFAPFVFAGPRSVALWLEGMRAHLEGISGLEHSFGDACDYGRAGGLAFFTLPTRWKGLARGRRFDWWLGVRARPGRRRMAGEELRLGGHRDFRE